MLVLKTLDQNEQKFSQPKFEPGSLNPFSVIAAIKFLCCHNNLDICAILTEAAIHRLTCLDFEYCLSFFFSSKVPPFSKVHISSTSGI